MPAVLRENGHVAASIFGGDPSAVEEVYTIRPAEEVEAAVAREAFRSLHLLQITDSVPIE